MAGSTAPLPVTAGRRRNGRPTGSLHPRRSSPPSACRRPGAKPAAECCVGRRPRPCAAALPRSGEQMRLRACPIRVAVRVARPIRSALLSTGHGPAQERKEVELAQPRRMESDEPPKGKVAGATPRWKTTEEKRWQSSRGTASLGAWPAVGWSRRRRRRAGASAGRPCGGEQRRGREEVDGADDVCFKT